MQSYNKKLKQLIEKSRNILIITHKSPDLDAFCSMIMVKKFIEQIDSRKKIVMKTRQYPTINLVCMKEISIVKDLRTEDEDLIIITDAGSIDLCLDDSIDTLEKANTPVLCIDHHVEDSLGNDTLIINEHRSSATEQVFASFKEILGRRFKITKEIAELTQYGIVADTGRFLYAVTTPDSLRFFADAREVLNVDLEDMAYKINKFPREANEAMIAYMKTLTIEKDMAYMYISKETIEENNLVKTGVNEAQSFLRDKYIRFIQGVHWGFIIKPDFDHENTWFVSFRSTKGYQDVGIIAQALGGGGHMYASASPISAENAEEALEKVLTTIRSLAIL